MVIHFFDGLNGKMGQPSVVETFVLPTGFLVGNEQNIVPNFEQNVLKKDLTREKVSKIEGN